MRPYEGLTLIELMISLAIIAVLFILAVPSLVNYFNDAKIRSVADDMQQGLQQAKMFATVRNTEIDFTMNGTGWTITIPQNGNTAAVTLATRTAAGNESVLSLTPANTTVVYNAFGQTVPFGSIYTFNITNPSRGTCVGAGGTVRCLNVEVSAMGEAKVCDPALPASDPRAC